VAKTAIECLLHISFCLQRWKKSQIGWFDRVITRYAQSSRFKTRCTLCVVWKHKNEVVKRKY